MSEEDKALQLVLGYAIDECWREEEACREKMLKYKDLKKVFWQQRQCWAILAHRLEATLRDNSWLEYTKRKNKKAGVQGK